VIRGARRAQSLSALLAAALAVVAVIVLPGVALAQSMTATLDTNELVQYQTAVLRIEVTDPPENAEIAFGGDPEERGFRLSYRASQRFERGRQRIVQGRIVNDSISTLTFYYAFTPTRTGDLTIDGIRLVDADGDFLGVAAAPVRVRVTAPSKRSDVLLEMSLGKDTLWVGERVTLSVSILRVPGTTFDGSVDFHPGGLEAVFDAENTPARSSRQQVSFMGGLVEIESDTADIAGVEFERFRFERELRASVPGTHTIDPIVLMTKLVGGGFDRAISISVPSDPITVEVRELPAEGRPLGFSGLVGSYELQASVEETDLRVGDPFTLTVLLSGSGGLESAPPPDVEGALGPGFRVRAEDNVRRDDSAMFVYTVRVLDASNDAIPPIPVPYFDPDSGEYAVARSGAVGISVQGSAINSLGDAGAALATSDGAALGERATIADARADLSANKRVSLVAAEPFDLRGVMSSPAVLALVAVPPVAYGLGALALLLVRRSDRSGGVGVRAAADRAKRALSASSAGGQDAAERVAAALVAYAAARSGREPGVCTPPEGARQIAADAPSLSERAQQLARAAEAGRYGGGASPTDADELARLFDELRTNREAPSPGAAA
jgi:hypothetical protein